MGGGGGGGGGLGGIVRSAGSALGNVGRAVTSPLGLVGGAMGAQAHMLGLDPFAKGPAAPEAPGTDPRMQEMINRQSQEVEKFRGSMPQKTQEMQAQALGQQREQTQAEKEGIRGSAQRRGLLYSGIRQGSEAGAEAQGAARGARAAAGIKEEMESGLHKMEDQLASMQMGQYQSDLARADTIYNAALARSRSNLSAGMSAGSAAGEFFGSALGGRASSGGKK